VPNCWITLGRQVTLRPVPPTRLPYEVPRWLTIDRVAMAAILWAPASLLATLLTVPFHWKLMMLFLCSASVQLLGARWAVHLIGATRAQRRILRPAIVCILGTMLGAMFTAPSFIILEPFVRERILSVVDRWWYAGDSSANIFQLMYGHPEHGPLLSVFVVTVICGFPILSYQVLVIVILVLQRHAMAHDAIDRAIVRAASLGILAGLTTLGLCWGIEARWLGALFAGVAALTGLCAQARLISRRRWLGKVAAGTVPGWTVLERTVQAPVSGPRLFVATDSAAPGEVGLLARVAADDPYRPTEDAEVVATIPLPQTGAGRR
jgi:hypothetical protein